MELIKDNLHMNKSKGKMVFSATVDEDFTIPEGKPGMDYKIKDMGEVCIEKVRPMEDRVSIGMCLYFGLLYNSGGNCQSYYGKANFEETAAMAGVTGQDIVRCKANLMDMKISVISSHKISVRAVVLVTVSAEEIYDREVIKKIEMDNVRDERLEVRMMKLIANRKDTFRIRESVNINQGMSNIGEIIWQELRVKDLCFTPADGRIDVKGNLSFFVIYQGENGGELNYYDNVVPFSGSLDISNGRQEDVYDINIVSCEKSLISRNDGNGETRIFDGEIIMSLDICGYRNEDVSLLTDIYAPGYEITPKTEKLEYERLVENKVVDIDINERIKNEDGGKIIYTCGDVIVDEIIQKDNKVDIEGTISVQLMMEDKEAMPPITVSHHDIPFSYQAGMDKYEKDSELCGKVNNISLSSKRISDKEISVNGTIKMEIMSKSTTTTPVVINADVEKVPKEKLKNIPGITGYIVKEGDTLWNIAKRFYTTADSIIEANNLENDMIYPGMKLIILKLYCF